MKLTAKLVALLVLVLTVLLAIDGYLAIDRDVFLVEESRRFSALQFGIVMQQVWQAGGHEQVKQLVEKLNAQRDGARVRFVWLDAPTEDFKEHFRESDDLERILGGEVVSFPRRDQSNNLYLFTYVRITSPLQRPGGLELSEPLSRSRAWFQEYVYRIMNMTGLIAVAGAFLVFVLGTEMVGRPLQQLIEKTRRIGKGDLTMPLQLRGHDEFSELATALNTMCDDISQSQDKAQREEAARIEALQQLRHADRLRTVGGLASGMAHELGTPLSVVTGRSQLIETGRLSPAEIEKSAHAIKVESERMKTIIQQLLDFSRRNTPRKSQVDLHHLAEQTIELLKSLPREVDATVRLDPTLQPIFAPVDAAQLQQVLTNLVVNAIQSMPSGGTVDIAIRRQFARPPEGSDCVEGNYVRIDIHDQGTGISEKHKQHLFEPFFTTKDVGQGTGLGLSVSYGIVQEHGGWIDVVSAEGEGSCFSVFLPEGTET